MRGLKLSLREMVLRGAMGSRRVARGRVWIVVDLQVWLLKGMVGGKGANLGTICTRRRVQNEVQFEIWTAQ